MWPQTLQMSEDDCRGKLRRLELEAYANIIGVFRAQGQLSEKKAKLLEELRNIFHISQDRHRAEARRVANDECLSTIAKIVSGPNTWQEWSREGRRSYPMLPRVAPHTALGWIANNLASEAALDNAKLPYPAETAAAALEEQAAVQRVKNAVEANRLRYSDKYVVTNDPFKLPDIPAIGSKKNLKRGMNDGHHAVHTSSSKKRNVNDTSPNKQKHITATSTNTSPNSGTTGSRRTISNAILQQQRYFYQQQQKAKKLAKAASKREKLPGTGKLGRKPKKLKEQELRQQREREQQEQMLQQQQQQHQQQYQQQEFINDESGNYEQQHQQQQQQQLMQRLDHSDYAISTNIANVMIDMGNQIQGSQQHPQQHQQHIDVMETQYITTGNNQKPLYMPIQMPSPQVASSKRDITKNLTKLQLPAASAQVVSTSPTTTIKQLDANSLSNQLSSTSNAQTILIGNKTITDCKLTPLSTPVQKYIVEDRQPHITTASAGALPPPLMGQQATTSQFVGGLSQGKLRPLNTTILPPGTKLTTTAKKLTGGTVLSATVLSPNSGGGGSSSPLLDNILGNSNTSTHLYNIVDGSGVVASGNQSNISTQSQSQQQQQQQQQQQILSQPTAPTHTPPAVIQLHNNEVLRLGTQQTQSSLTSSGGNTSTQSKVLTTKILPIVLSSNSAKAADTVKNGSPSIVSVSSSNVVSNSPGATIIKSLPASLLVSGGQHSGSSSATGSSSPVFSTFGSSGSLYRKQPNILRSSSTPTGRLQNSATKFGGPQIISNIRLTPAISTTSGTNSPFGGNSPQTSIFQQQLRNVPSTSTGMRTSVKICQSPNGKVFIQPANAEGFKLSKFSSGHISQRLIPSTILSGNTTNLTLSAGSGNNSGIGSLSNKTASPRIAIQKVQIIPAPSAGVTGTTLHQTQQQRLGTTTLTLGSNVSGSGVGKSNLFIQGRQTTGSGGSTITLGKSTSLGSPSTKNLSKASNVVVIDAGGAVNKILPHQKKMSTLSTVNSNIIHQRSNLDNSQMITEDTPVDIIDIVDSPTETPSVTPTPANEPTTTSATSITAVLASNVLNDNVQQLKQQQQETVVVGTPQQQLLATHKQQNSSVTMLSPTPTPMVPMTMLSATDWEMELDQAKAASSTQHTQQQSGSNNDVIKTQQQQQQQQFNQQQQQQSEQIETADTIIIDDSFEDVIIEEEEEEEHEDTTATESEQYDSEDQQHQHQQNEQQLTEKETIEMKDDNDKIEPIFLPLVTVKETKSNIEIEETNYESVPMCIDENIETTQFDGGNKSQLSEDDTDVMSMSGNDISSLENTEKSDVKGCNINKDALEKTTTTLNIEQNEKIDDETITTTTNLTNNIELELKEANLTTTATVTPKNENLILNNKVQDEDDSTINTTTTTSSSTTTTITTVSTPIKTTTTISASLVTVKDYDEVTSESNSKTNPEIESNVKTNFDKNLNDEVAKSNQSDVINTAQTEQ